ncbi:membrane protein [Polymorphobacter glacialis]|uniref:Membrane protein n=1 Tax=Sandarakinorhabdus glacialis TaxID=1614636 RepID=A0A917E3I9_9SPHN|nr:membrane protein [Polymorphobacter glacialis]
MPTDTNVPSREIPGAGANGFLMLAAMLLLVAIGIFVLSRTIAGAPFSILFTVLAIMAFFFVTTGFYKIAPNEAAAITLFGAYRGSDRTPGLRWTWPWMHKAKISLRAHNLISQTIKVNDQRGNPIEIAAQVVWRVTDSAQALFDVDDYRGFVAAQIEVAVRTIGARYPYDDFTHQEVTLRGDHERIGGELRAELMARLAVAGITVDECGFTHLAYAPEIAGAMLRRQQAAAVVAARETLVAGAVGMVEMALALLSEKNVVHLDDEPRRHGQQPDGRPLQ